MRIFDGAQNQGRFAGASVEKADGDAAIGLAEDLRGHAEAGDFVARRKNNLVARDAKRTIEDDGVAFGVVALRVLVGFDDEETRLAGVRYGAGESDFDVVGGGIGVGQERIAAGVGATDNFEVERLAGHRVVDRLVAGDAAFADGVIEDFGALGEGGDFVTDFEAGGLGGEELVAGVLVGFGLLAGRRGVEDRVGGLALCEGREREEKGCERGEGGGTDRHGDEDTARAGGAPGGVVG